MSSSNYRQLFLTYLNSNVLHTVNKESIVVLPLFQLFEDLTNTIQGMDTNPRELVKDLMLPKDTQTLINLYSSTTLVDAQDQSVPRNHLAEACLTVMISNAHHKLLEKITAYREQLSLDRIREEEDQHHAEFTTHQLSPTEGSSSQETPKVVVKRKRIIFTKHSQAILKDWFARNETCPYPSEVERKELARQTGLRVSQVTKWFTNFRCRYSKAKRMDNKQQKSRLVNCTEIFQKTD